MKTVTILSILLISVLAQAQQWVAGMEPKTLGAKMREKGMNVVELPPEDKTSKKGHRLKRNIVKANARPAATKAASPAVKPQTQNKESLPAVNPCPSSCKQLTDFSEVKFQAWKSTTLTQTIKLAQTVDLHVYAYGERLQESDLKTAKDSFNAAKAKSPQRSSNDYVAPKLLIYSTQNQATASVSYKVTLDLKGTPSLVIDREFRIADAVTGFKPLNISSSESAQGDWSQKAEFAIDLVNKSDLGGRLSQKRILLTEKVEASFPKGDFSASEKSVVEEALGRSQYLMEHRENRDCRHYYSGGYRDRSGYPCSPSYSYFKSFTDKLIPAQLGTQKFQSILEKLISSQGETQVTLWLDRSAGRILVATPTGQILAKLEADSGKIPSMEVENELAKQVEFVLIALSKLQDRMLIDEFLGTYGPLKTTFDRIKALVEKGHDGRHTDIYEAFMAAIFLLEVVMKADVDEDSEVPARRNIVTLLKAQIEKMNQRFNISLKNPDFQIIGLMAERLSRLTAEIAGLAMRRDSQDSTRLSLTKSLEKLDILAKELAVKSGDGDAGSISTIDELLNAAKPVLNAELIKNNTNYHRPLLRFCEFFAALKGAEFKP